MTPAIPRTQRPAPPPLPQGAPAGSAAPVAEPTEPSLPASAPPPVDVRPIVLALVERATAPLERTVETLGRRVDDLQRRVEELERRPVAVAPALVASPTIAASPVPIAASSPRMAQTSPAPWTNPGPPARTVAAMSMNDAADIEMDGKLDAFNGRRRQRRLLFRMGLVIFVTFGGLFFALAQSYMHAHP